MRRGLGGSVRVQVTVAPDGSVERMDVAQSSGNRYLDRAAMDAVRRWRFNPAMRNGENDALVNAENADRQAVYADIAQRTGTTAQEVGKRRALQIAQLAAPGHWLQAADGRWYQK